MITHQSSYQNWATTAEAREIEQFIKELDDTLKDFKTVAILPVSEQ
jgi:hypothetical protein